jgi:ribonuclease E
MAAPQRKLTMERRMLINATQAEECRIAIIDDRQLFELEIESSLSKKLKGNIYKARIARIEPSLQAAFLDLGTNRNGFLQINDVHPAFFRDNPRLRGQKGGRIRIQDVLSPGQELISIFTRTLSRTYAGQRSRRGIKKN